MLLGFFPLWIHPQPQHTSSIPFDPKPNLALNLFFAPRQLAGTEVTYLRGKGPREELTRHEILQAVADLVGKLTPMLLRVLLS